jgi:hypothetical protein
MIELIVFAIFIFSLIGIGIILFRKIPLLLELPETSPPFSWKAIFLRIKNLFSLKRISTELLLQKILSRIRILTLKTDSKTSSLLQKLRERSQKKKFGENDNYWREIRRKFRQ